MMIGLIMLRYKEHLTTVVNSQTRLLFSVNSMVALLCCYIRSFALSHNDLRILVKQQLSSNDTRNSIGNLPVVVDLLFQYAKGLLELFDATFELMTTQYHDWLLSKERKQKMIPLVREREGIFDTLFFTWMPPLYR